MKLLGSSLPLALVGTLLWAYTGTVSAVSSVIMPPVRTSGDEVALVFIPGASIDGMAYKDTALAIQDASPLRLWVALTRDYLLDTPNPAQIPGAVEGAIASLKAAGMKGDNFIGIAHSLGGVFLGPYAPNSALKGVVFLGSYLTRGNSLHEYPLPVLTLSGELDGQTRITRIAATFQELQILVKSDPTALYSKPVLNIKGSSHAQFASGPMPSLVQKYDLEPEVTIEDAHKAIGQRVSDFLSANFIGDEELADLAKEDLHKAYLDSQRRFQPLLDVKRLDQSGSTSPWAVVMQGAVAGQVEGNIQTTDAVENYADFLSSKPAVKREGSDGLVVSTTSYLEYPSNPLDISTNPESPEVLEVKMKSFGAIQAFATRTLPRAWRGVKQNVTCKDLNQLAIRTALANSTSDARRRYESRGRPIVLKDDIAYYTGIQWSSVGISLRESDSGLSVQSVSLFTSTESPILPGMYYCKCLSPYRAMEWVNVDSLRARKP